MTTRRPRMQLVVLLLLFVSAGAIVNVAVAWGLVLFKTRTDPVPGRFFYPIEEAEGNRLADLGWQQLPISGRTREVRLLGVDTEAIGLTLHRVDESEHWKDVRSTGIQNRTAMYETNAGWPCLALGGLRFDASSPTKRLAGQETWVHKTAVCVPESNLHISWDRPLPFGPLLPGFAINTMFYAAVLWMLFALPFALRRRRRIKRGLCWACAYPVGGSPVCIECGTAVPSCSS